MGTVCLSPAPALRCVGLSLTQEAITLVPAALEVVFSLGLVFVEGDAGRVRYILAAEGPIYLLLAVLGLLNRLIPFFEYSLEAHKVLDIIIGAASFIPIFLYTFYLYLFKRRAFFPDLPKRFALMAKAFAWAVIPIIIVTNEIGSLLGIQYRKVPGPESRIVGKQIAVGPDLSSFQFGREFLRSTSLALLVIYQLITFLLFFTRLASCIMAQRDIENRAAAEREGIIFRGIGWLAIGMKISAIESATGFASTSFGIVLTRRILRMLGRACIIIGVLKGVDRREEFFILDSDNLKGNEFLSGTRKLKMPGKRFTISGPHLVRSSMAQRMSRMTSLRPSLATFTIPRGESPSSSDVERTPFVSRPSSEFRADWPIPPFAATAKFRPSPLQLDRISSESHVSVVHGYNRAPTLVLNLSPMELPSSDIFAVISRGSENQTSSSTVVDIDYVSVPPMPLSAPVQRSAPPPQFVAVTPPGIPSGSSDGKGSRPSQDYEHSRRRSSRRRSLSSAVPSIPIGISRMTAPASPESFVWPSTETERSESVIESPQPSGDVALARTRADASQSTLGGILIDWIAPEGAGDGRAPGVARFKSVGAAPRRTTPNPTSAGAVRSSVMLERHESMAVTGTRARAQSRREMPRKDSGVLGMDDPALRRGSPRPL